MLKYFCVRLVSGCGEGGWRGEVLVLYFLYRSDNDFSNPTRGVEVCQQFLVCFCPVDPQKNAENPEKLEAMDTLARSTTGKGPPGKAMVAVRRRKTITMFLVYFLFSRLFEGAVGCCH
jgi:hypothetical protein